MTKIDFLYKLDEKLSGLPEEDRSKSIEYYSEIIDDRIEEGYTESGAVAALGNIDDIVDTIISEIPLSRIIKAKVKVRKALEPWKIVLIVFGAITIVPVVISLIAAAISVYASLWAVAVSLYAVVVSLAAGGVGGVIAFFPLLIFGETASAFILLGLALASLGLVIPFFHISKYFTKLAILITKGIIFLIKKSIVKKEAKK